jgi:transposase
MDWPSYNPDLNPIKNLWALLKAKIYILYPELVGVFNNAEALDLWIRYAMDTWDRLGEDLLNRLINAMECRVRAVINAKG